MLGAGDRVVRIIDVVTTLKSGDSSGATAHKNSLYFVSIPV